MPGIERRREEAAGLPLELLLGLALLPYLRGAAPVQHVHDFLVEVVLGLQHTARWDLDDVHAGHAGHAFQHDVRAPSAGPPPVAARDLSDVGDTVAFADRDRFLIEPQLITGLSF